MAEYQEYLRFSQGLVPPAILENALLLAVGQKKFAVVALLLEQFNLTNDEIIIGHAVKLIDILIKRHQGLLYNDLMDYQMELMKYQNIKELLNRSAAVTSSNFMELRKNNQLWFNLLPKDLHETVFNFVLNQK